jgi:NTE family protein
MLDSKFPALTLALSGGGAKCAAEAGVLGVLEQNGFRVRAMSGVSAGGLVAVLYALGHKPAAIRDFIAETHLLELWEFDRAHLGLLGTSKLRIRLQSAVGEKTFDDLAVPVVLVSADLKTGQEVHLNTGRLDDALIATMALPGIFPPHARNGQFLIDGGLVNPLAIDVARRLGGPVVAVDLLGEAGVVEPPTQLFEARGPAEYATRVGRRLGLFDTIEVVHQAALITTRRLRDSQLQTYPPDVLLRPAVSLVGLFASDLAAYAYEKGQSAARAAMPDLNRLTRFAWLSQLMSAWRKHSGAWRYPRPLAKH